MKMYGPYLRKDGRKHVVLVDAEGKKTSKSWPRVLMEQHLGRELTPEETVDHIDEDFTNDDLSNLQLLTREDNSRKHNELKPAEIYEFQCPCCGKMAKRFMREVKRNRKNHKQGPYCSRVCAGKATYINPWKDKLS